MCYRVPVVSFVLSLVLNTLQGQNTLLYLFFSTVLSFMDVCLKKLRLINLIICLYTTQEKKCGSLRQRILLLSFSRGQPGEQTVAGRLVPVVFCFKHNSPK